MNRATQICLFRHNSTHPKRLCLNSDRPVNTATRLCLLIQLKPASAAMNARFAQAASKLFCSTFARTVAADLFRDQFDPQQIGGATIASGKTRRASGSGTGRWIRLRMQCLQQPSNPSPRRRDKIDDSPSDFGARSCKSRRPRSISQLQYLTRQLSGGGSFKAASRLCFSRTANRSCGGFYA